VAAPDHYQSVAGQPFTLPAPGVLANDTDADGRALTAKLVRSTTHGTLTLNADGSLSYTAESGYSGQDSFTYVANDGIADSNVATAVIDVALADQPPTAAPDSYSIAPNGVLSVAAPGVLGNDTDPEGQTLTAHLVASTAHGALGLNPDGSFVYAPSAGYSGTDSFTYQASDGMALSGITTVTIEVSVPNMPPVANPDNYGVTVDTSLSVPAPGVLGNDSDPQGLSLTAALVDPAMHGTVNVGADGSFTYTPDPGYTGGDSFTYEASDGIMTSPPTLVMLNVGRANTPPVAVTDNYSVDQGSSLNVPAPGVLANDSDPDGDPLTARLVTDVAHGALVLNADGSFAYTPAASYSGPDSFTYQANDGFADSNVATVVIDVVRANTPPTANPDSYSVLSDMMLVVPAPGVLANDTDPNGQTLTAALVNGPAHGSVLLNADGSFSYTPSAGYVGPDSFTYRANDGVADSNVAVVTISVGQANTPPTANPDSYMATAGAALNVAAPGVLANDTDPLGQALTAKLVTSPAHGSLTLNADGSFVYTADVTYSGPDSFTYQANDGIADSNVATVSITVKAANRPPTANPDNYGVASGAVLMVAAPGVLANDTDPDGQTLTARLVAGPAHGMLTLHPDGSFVYTPTAGYNGTDSFTYVANDGIVDSNVATVSISVSQPNTPPTANPDSYSASASVSLSVPAPGVLANDTDPDVGQTLTARLVMGPTHGTLGLNADGSFVYAPNPTYSGTDVFTYQANDGLADSNVATVTITVDGTPVARDDVATVANGGNVIINVLANDTDPEREPLTVTSATAPLGTVTIQPDNTLSYTAPATFTNPITITYQIRDTATPPNTASARVVVVKRPSFGTAVTYTVGTAPVAVALGDINRDGRTDVAVANSGSNNASIFYQQSGGTLSPASGSPVNVGMGPSAVGIGQMQGSSSGSLEVAVANRTDNTVTIINFSGSPPQTTLLTMVGASPGCIATGNLDKASRDDVVVGNIGAASNVNILYASFTGAPTVLSAGTDPSGVAVSDLDADTNLDIVVSNATSNNVTVFRQATLGTFTSSNYPAGASPSSVAIGDFNGDSRPDIVVANAGAGTVSVLLQTSGGQFAAAVDFPAGPNPSSVAVGQLNGDTLLDIVVTNRVSATTNNVSVLVNATLSGATAPLFSAPVTLSSGGAMPTSVAVGNLTSDTKPDIAVVNRDSNNLAVLPGQN
jgi:VCBS repeat-containing protein